MKWIRKLNKTLGPGLLVAASGIGAGDMVIGLQAGFHLNILLPLVLLLTCLLKYVLTEGVARWHLSTGTSMVNAWISKWPGVFSGLFFLFFLIWSLFVAAALMSACGLAGNALFPQLSVPVWGVIHSALALALIFIGKYKGIERIATLLILLMFIVIFVVLLRLLIAPNMPNLASSSVIDGKSLSFAMLGAIGGSFTILSYGYWIKEKGWNASQYLKDSRYDLQFSYLLTFLFVGMLIAVAYGFRGEVTDTNGSRFILDLSNTMGDQIGFGIGLIFKIGFWGVVFSSLLAVWDGVPYIFEDFMINFTRKVKARVKWYQYYLIAIAVIPAVLLFTQSALKNIINYAIISSIFSLVLTLSLLFFDRDKRVNKAFKHTLFTRIVLWMGVLCFLALVVYQLFE